MAFDGNGTFNRPVSSYVFDTVIDQDDVNTEMDGMATGLSNALCKDGQQTATANQPMGGYRHTGVGNASARNHYAVAGQIQDGDYLEIGSVAGTDTITGSVSPAITAYAQGQTFRFVAAGTNTGATTINLNSVGAKAIQKLGAALVAGDITSGDAVEIYYDGTQFQMLSPARTPVLANKTGVDANLVSGTAGTDGNLAQWNSDGDIVDGPDVLDEDNMASDSASAVATQQSIKAYVDTRFTINTTDSLAGTAHESTGIPAGTKEVVIGVEGASLNATGDILIQLGDSGGFEDTGYLSYASLISGTSVSGSSNPTSGFNVTTTGLPASMVVSGRIVLSRINSSTHTWAIDGRLMRTDSAGHFIFSGTKTLTAELTQIRFTTTAGTATFDAGTITRVDKA